jgi:PBP1b-binding outer membrane lipoprotein LpoB
MKKLLYISGLALLLTACGGDHRDTKDQTDPKEENISPNQTVTDGEQAKKDSTQTDYILSDSATENAERDDSKPSN